MPKATVTFPLLAVSISSGRLGIACLDRHLRLREARVVSLERFRTREEKCACAARHLSMIVRRLSPTTAVLEERPPGPRSNEARAITADLVGRLGAFAAQRTTFRAACEAIVGHASAAQTATSLAGRYDVLLRELRPGPCAPFGAGRYPTVRPLLAAVALAHATALEAVKAWS